MELPTIARIHSMACADNTLFIIYEASKGLEYYIDTLIIDLNHDSDIGLKHITIPLNSGRPLGIQSYNHTIYMFFSNAIYKYQNGDTKEYAFPTDIGELLDYDISVITDDQLLFSKQTNFDIVGQKDLSLIENDNIPVYYLFNINEETTKPILLPDNVAAEKTKKFLFINHYVDQANGFLYLSKNGALYELSLTDLSPKSVEYNSIYTSFISINDSFIFFNHDGLVHYNKVTKISYKYSKLMDIKYSILLVTNQFVLFSSYSKHNEIYQYDMLNHTLKIIIRQEQSNLDNAFLSYQNNATMVTYDNSYFCQLNSNDLSINNAYFYHNDNIQIHCTMYAPNINYLYYEYSYIQDTTKSHAALLNCHTMENYIISGQRSELQFFSDNQKFLYLIYKDSVISFDIESKMSTCVSFEMELSPKQIIKKCADTSVYLICEQNINFYVSDYRLFHLTYDSKGILRPYNLYKIPKPRNHSAPINNIIFSFGDNGPELYKSSENMQKNYWELIKSYNNTLTTSFALPFDNMDYPIYISYSPDKAINLLVYTHWYNGNEFTYILDPKDMNPNKVLFPEDYQNINMEKYTKKIDYNSLHKNIILTDKQDNTLHANNSPYINICHCHFNKCLFSPEDVKFVRDNGGIIE